MSLLSANKEKATPKSNVLLEYQNQQSAAGAPVSA